MKKAKGKEGPRILGVPCCDRFNDFYDNTYYVGMWTAYRIGEAHDCWKSCVKAVKLSAE